MMMMLPDGLGVTAKNCDTYGWLVRDSFDFSPQEQRSDEVDYWCDERFRKNGDEEVDW